MNTYKITFHCDDGDPAQIIRVEKDSGTEALIAAARLLVGKREVVTAEVEVEY